MVYPLANFGPIEDPSTPGRRSEFWAIGRADLRLRLAVVSVADVRPRNNWSQEWGVNSSTSVNLQVRIRRNIGSQERDSDPSISVAKFTGRIRGVRSKNPVPPNYERLNLFPTRDMASQDELSQVGSDNDVDELMAQ